MRLSPLDIQSQQFRVKMRGYETREVENFLEMVAAEFEELIRENGKLKEKLARLTNQLDELRQREQTLKETMITAQKVTGDMKMAARKEAELIISEAELKAERTIDDAHRKLAVISDQIMEIRRLRAQFEVQIKSAAESHLKILEISSEAIEEEMANAKNVKYLVSKE
ncbi:MAG: DivIVA domain-containing protein [Deltaproteobacteria bacterium]|nr:DivIVA domain-containing protein [Deltaproteobacteria bacterium]